jgi:hypothetical protein
MADHPGLDDGATVGGEQTAAGERGAASPERRAAATGPPIFAVIKSGPTPACFLAHRTSLMKLSRQPRLPMRPIRISNSLSSLLTGTLRVAGAEKSLENELFAFEWHCRPTDAPRKAKPYQRLGAAWGRPFYLAVVRPEPSNSNPAHSSTRRRSFVICDFGACRSPRNAAQTRYRRAAEWLSEGPFERRFSVRRRQSARLRDARSANCRRLRHDRKESALAGAFIIVRRGGWSRRRLRVG